MAIIFLISGRIHELRIHIPWMALASESVAITISTIEISLRLQDPNEERDEEKISLLSSEFSARSPQGRRPIPGPQQGNQE